MLAVGGAVEVGALGGVAAAIAVGARSFILAFSMGGFGMTVKVAEVSLACYYRCKDSHGNYYGGPSYHIEEVLVNKKVSKGKKFWHGVSVCHLFWQLFRKGFTYCRSAKYLHLISQ